jgi:CDP-glycerol glycerophosphotransferase
VLRPGHPPVLAEPDPALFDVLPLHAVGPDLRLSLRRRPNGQAAIVLGAPLALDEVTRHGRGRLRTTYRTSPVPPLTDAVLFQSDEGHRVDGPVLALDAALAEARPGWQRYWSVQSLHTAVPAGAIPVVVGSARWYDVLAAAPLLVGDSPFTEWQAKRPHQRLVQVAPGWPVSSLGAAHAAERGLPVGQAALLADLVRQWNLLVAPSQAAADLYRRETGYAGEVVLAAPQTDLLVAPPDGLRERVRAELGLAADTVAVLYAPTCRESRSNRVDAAPMYDGLDLADLAARLGPGHTVLLHAHRHDRRAAERRTLRTPVVDVSDYPRLGELLLAADAAVLDYGAIRADWALTGRPTVFLTPDRAAYENVRAPLVDYKATLCGPQAATTAEVAALLADLPALRDTCAPLAARVATELNPTADGRGAARVVSAL